MVLRDMLPKASISLKAMDLMEQIIEFAFHRIADEAARLARLNKTSVLTCREIQTAVKLVLPGALARNAVADGAKTVLRYYL